MPQDARMMLAEEEEDTQHGRYLTFMLGAEIYGIEICHVSEIIGVQPITRMPEMPAYIRGIINLRGKIFPVIDMRLKFHKEPTEYTERTCIIVAEVQDIPVGLIVDGVSEVLAIGPEEIMPPPEAGGSAESGYILGIAKGAHDLKILLACPKLLRNEELEPIADLNKEEKKKDKAAKGTRINKDAEKGTVLK
jgi:purine-binding chemotaxis protein CheW